MGYLAAESFQYDAQMCGPFELLSGACRASRRDVDLVKAVEALAATAKIQM